ncbi:hypothetical protein J3R30DRAFT_3287781 [Lentinula aciculospora]|uniref:Uncharacterized protein n=1 Tax=Lentinula aciculospora TaxID=153920 RepID=A0A9W9DRF2_9AGAR|nr:hypothetical protein J3R30DRAFT_3287781 [Lentinula aciculospora]
MMSNVNEFSSADALRPSHHVHSSDDPLPGAQRGVNTVDYSAETMERTPSTWNDSMENQFTRAHPEMTGQREVAQHPHHDSLQQSHGEGNGISREQRPVDVQPPPVGGVSVGGNADLPEGKASVMDKVVGKTQKIIGKAAHNPDMHEKGELRETGGKAAARGEPA